MEAILKSKIRYKAFITARGLLLLALAVWTAGCASARKAPTATEGAPRTGTPEVQGPPAPVEVMGPPEAFGPVAPSPTPAPPVYGPEPVLIRPVVLVLGPGMAKGYAYAGALRALSDAKIPIGAILGTEMGALVGAIYAMDGNINHFDWAMLKFKEEVFTAEKKLIPTRKLEGELLKVFGTKDLSSGKIPLRVALERQGYSVVLDKGPAGEALRAALAAPELLGPGKWLGIPAISAKKSRPFLVSEARSLGTGPVVVIDVMDPRDSARVTELRDADLVIRPDMKGIGEFDFQKRTEAAFRGKQATQERLKEIRQKVGLPESGP